MHKSPGFDSQYWVGERRSNSIFDEHPGDLMAWVPIPHFREYQWCKIKSYNQDRMLLKFRDPGVPSTWKAHSLVSTANLGFQGTQAVSASGKAAAILSLAPHRVCFDSSRGHLTSSLAGRKRRLLVLKLHTLWPHPSDPLLHQLIQAISASLSWHFQATLPQMWEVSQLSTNWHAEFNVQLWDNNSIYCTGHKQIELYLLGWFPLGEGFHTASPLYSYKTFLLLLRHSQTHICLFHKLFQCDCGKNFIKWLLCKTEQLHFGQKVPSTSRGIPWHRALTAGHWYILAEIMTGNYVSFHTLRETVRYSTSANPHFKCCGNYENKITKYCAPQICMKHMNITLQKQRIQGLKIFNNLVSDEKHTKRLKSNLAIKQQLYIRKNPFLKRNNSCFL